jgi:hypothetical protein
MAAVGLKSQGGGGAMVPRSTPVGEVPPPLSAIYTGLILRRRGRWKFSTGWHKKDSPYSRFFFVAISILGVDLIPGLRPGMGVPPLPLRGRGGTRYFFFHDVKIYFYKIFFVKKCVTASINEKSGFAEK